MKTIHRYALALCLLLTSLWCLFPPKRTVWSDESGRPVSERLIDLPRLVTRLGFFWTLAAALYVLLPNPARLLEEDEESQEIGPKDNLI